MRHPTSWCFWALLLSFFHIDKSVSVITLSARPSQLSGEATWVDISWSGINFSPNSTNDMLAIYADVEQDVEDLPPHHDPLYYVMVGAQTRAGSVKPIKLVYHQ
jgi:hypothetical protein